MKTFVFVWVLVAFALTGFKLLPKTENFVVQDFESTASIVNHPLEFLPGWSANDFRDSPSRTFIAAGEGINSSNALAIQTISNFNAQIYIKTSTVGLKNPRISFQAKTLKNGNGNRPVILYHAMAMDPEGTFSEPLPIGDETTFPNENTPYQIFGFEIPPSFLEIPEVFIRLDVVYGEGSGSAARLLIDDFSLATASEEPTENPLSVISVNVLEATSLMVEFNEPIQLPKAAISLNNAYGAPEKMEVLDNQLILEFGTYLYSNVYTLHFEELKSTSGDQLLADQNFDFEVETPTPAGAIIINEVMADPNPKGLVPTELTLPTASDDEYIELYNRMDKPIRIRDFTYNDGIFEDVVIEPESYVILVPAANMEVFSSWGKTVGVAGFRALPNGGGAIEIKDSFGNVLDRLLYDEGFYQNNQKSQGGWSLERINPYQACSDEYNWKSSTAETGGTPGMRNAVYSDLPDERPFEVKAIRPLSAHILEVEFSKALSPEWDEANLLTLSGNALKLDSVSNRHLWLNLPVPLEPGVQYDLEIQSLFDCYGQALTGNSFPFEFDINPPSLIQVIGLAPDELQLEFDENLSDTTIVDPSRYKIHPFEGEVNAAHLDNEALSRVILTLGQPLELGQRYQITVNGVADVVGNTMLGDTLEFLWEDHLDTLIYFAPTILKVVLSSQVSKNTALNPGNYQLSHDLGQPERVLKDPEKENTYQLIFGREFPANVPISVQPLNLVDHNGHILSALRKSFVWDTRPIAVTTLDVTGPTGLYLQLNKPLDSKWALVPQFFQVSPEVGSPVLVELMAPDQIALFFDREWEQQKAYELLISGLRDIYGQEMNRDIHLPFIWDTLPPQIDTVYLSTPYDLVIVMDKGVEKPDSLLINGEYYETTMDENGEKLQVHHPDGWTDADLEINFPQVMDQSGNIGENLYYHLLMDNIHIGRLLIYNENELVLAFTEFLDPVNALFPDHYSVNLQVPQSVELIDNGYEIRLQLSQPLVLKDTVKIKVHSLKSLQGKEARNLSIRDNYDDGIHEIWVQQAQLIQVFHEMALDQSRPFHDLFKLMDSEMEVEALLNQSQPEQIQLILDQPLPEGEMMTLIIPPRTSAKGVWISGSQRQLIWDPSPPALLMVEPLSGHEFLLHFDKALDPVLAVVPVFYAIEGLQPLEVLFGAEANQVILVFDRDWEDGESLNLTITQLEDLHRNAIDELTYTFTPEIPKTPGFKEIVINEMMPVPRPDMVLPDVEYVEIHNPTASPFQLGGMKLANSRSYTTLPRETMEPNSLIILCPLNQAAEFEGYGKVIGLSPWPTLLNGGDEVLLYDSKDLLIDRMLYQTGMPGGQDISQNGFSLELVNPYYPCETMANLRPSRDEQRGTPGTTNSVFDDAPDRTAPQLLSAYPIGDHKILLEFSKPVGPGYRESILKVMPEVSVEAFYPDSMDNFNLVVILDQPLASNQAYQIQVENWRDCGGILIDAHANQAVFKIPGIPEEGDILLNEVLFNPNSGGSKFVEIYNTSSKYINLKNWKLANIINGEISNRRVISPDDFILDPFSFLVLTTDTTSLILQYPKGKGEAFFEMNLPSYPIRNGTIILTDPEESWVERFDYDESFHHGFLRDPKGISLERYSLSSPTNDSKNWHSAASTEGYATPGYPNSQVYAPGDLARGLKISPEVFIPEAAGEQPFTTISYKMDQPGYLATLRIYATNGLLIQELCQNQVWGASGFYTWDGTNQKGARVKAGYYIVWAEVFHPNGQVQNLKKTVVVGVKF
ncbi:MAG: lamin tail domain-containing protein [Cyclobacteriaceae bacterium]